MQTGIRFSFSVLGLQQLDAKPRCHDQLARIALGLAAHTTPTVSFVRDYWRLRRARRNSALAVNDKFEVTLDRGGH